MLEYLVLLGIVHHGINAVLSLLAREAYIYARTRPAPPRGRHNIYMHAELDTRSCLSSLTLRLVCAFLSYTTMLEIVTYLNNASGAKRSSARRSAAVYYTSTAAIIHCVLSVYYKTHVDCVQLISAPPTCYCKTLQWPLDKYSR